MGHRFYNWEFSTSVQHEVVPRLSAEVGYFRRWFGNFQVTDDLAVEPSDFTPFSITAPRDPRLPDGGGYVVDGLFNVTPAKFGQVLDYNTLSDKYGKQTEHWNGVDVTSPPGSARRRSSGRASTRSRPSSTSRGAS